MLKKKWVMHRDCHELYYYLLRLPVIPWAETDYRSDIIYTKNAKSNASMQEEEISKSELRLNMIVIFTAKRHRQNRTYASPAWNQEFQGCRPRPGMGRETCIGHLAGGTLQRIQWYRLDDLPTVIWTRRWHCVVRIRDLPEPQRTLRAS